MSDDLIAKPERRENLPSSPTANRYQRAFIFVSLAGLLFLIHDFVWPLLVGGVFCVVLFPFYSRLVIAWKRPYLSAWVVTTIFVISFLIPLAGLVFFGVRAIIKQVERFSGESANQTVERLKDFLQDSDAASFFSSVFPGSEERVQETLLATVQKAGEGILGAARGFMAQIPEVAIAALVIGVAVFVFLINGEKILKYIRGHSFFNLANTNAVLVSLHAACLSAIFASVMTGLIQAGILTVGAALAGIGELPLIAISVFICSFLPMLGTLPVVVVVGGYLLINGSMGPLVIILVFSLIAGVADNIARPFFIEGKTEIHPLAAFVFTFGALNTMGIYGLFLGPVAAGFFFSLLNLIDREPNVPLAGRRIDE